MVAGALAKDINGLSAVGPYDTGNNVGKMPRGSNVSGDFADTNVVLVDSQGNAYTTEIPADGITSGRALVASARESRYNGATWDRVLNNSQFTLLASAARTVTTTTPSQVNLNGRGLWLFLNIGTVSAGGVKLSLNFLDPVTNTPGLVYQDASFITVTGIYLFEFFIGGAAAVSNVRASVSRSVPRIWTATITPGDANSQNYSLGGCYVSV